MNLIPFVLMGAALLLSMTVPDLHSLKDYILEAISSCSVLHTILPPWDWKPQFIQEGLADFPSAQKVFYMIFGSKYYKLLIYTVGYIAINGRSTLWQSISIKKQLQAQVAAPAVPPSTGAGTQGS